MTIAPPLEAQIPINLYVTLAPSQVIGVTLETIENLLNQSIRTFASGIESDLFVIQDVRVAPH